MNNKKKTLVAYFSCSGITKKLAESISEIIGSDLYKIKPEVPYTAADLDWTNKQSRSSIEMNNLSSRPAIAGMVSNMAEYDIIFVGFPIWWYVAPKIINTFLESYDFSGKTIIPFATSGSSGLGKTVQVLKSLCSDSVFWRPGKRLNGNASKEELVSWIDSLNLN